MWGLIIEKDDIQEGCRWFRKRDFAKAFATNKLAQAKEMDAHVIHINGKAVAEIQNFLRAKVDQQGKIKANWDLQTLAGLVNPNPELCVWVLNY